MKLQKRNKHKEHMNIKGHNLSIYFPTQILPKKNCNFAVLHFINRNFRLSRILMQAPLLKQLRICLKDSCSIYYSSDLICYFFLN